jgi:DNA-binding response OmpR family regulator
MTDTLAGTRLLIVEDEALVALMVEDILIDLGCIVVDVAGSVERGLSIANDPGVALDGAVLDVNLGGETVYPVADALAAKGVPFIFATGYGVAGISSRFSHIPALAKPYDPRLLETTLSAALRGAPGPAAGAA